MITDIARKSASLGSYDLHILMYHVTFHVIVLKWNVKKGIQTNAMYTWQKVLLFR